MQKAVFKILSIVTLLVLFSSILVANVPAYAVWGHGTSYGPQYGAGPYVTYDDGLKINGISYDISKFSTSIPTQKFYVNTPSNISFKIYHHASSQFIQHVVLYFNLKNNLPQAGQSDTWVEYDKYSGLTTHDPNGFFKNTSVNVTYDQHYMYITFTVTPAKPMDTSSMIVRAWDFRLSTSEAVMLNAIKIGYLPQSFSG